MAYHFAIVLIDFVEARDAELDDVEIVAVKEAEKLLVEAVAAVFDVKWSEAELVEEFSVEMMLLF